MGKGGSSGARRLAWRVTPFRSCDGRHDAEADDDEDADDNPCVRDMQEERPVGEAAQQHNEPDDVKRES